MSTELKPIWCPVDLWAVAAKVANDAGLVYSTSPELWLAVATGSARGLVDERTVSVANIKLLVEMGNVLNKSYKFSIEALHEAKMAVPDVAEEEMKMVNEGLAAASAVSTLYEKTVKEMGYAV